jgi:hypothetical protein
MTRVGAAEVSIFILNAFLDFYFSLGVIKGSNYGWS